MQVGNVVGGDDALKILPAEIDDDLRVLAVDEAEDIEERLVDFFFGLLVDLGDPSVADIGASDVE